MDIVLVYRLYSKFHIIWSISNVAYGFILSIFLAYFIRDFAVLRRHDPVTRGICNIYFTLGPKIINIPSV